jgi:hypothetical protein
MTTERMTTPRRTQGHGIDVASLGFDVASIGFDVAYTELAFFSFCESDHY